MPTTTHLEPSYALAFENPSLFAAFFKPQFRPSFTSFPGKPFSGNVMFKEKQRKKKIQITGYTRDLGFPDLVIKGEKIQTLEKKLVLLWWACAGEVLREHYSENKWMKKRTEREKRSKWKWFFHGTLICFWNFIFRDIDKRFWWCHVNLWLRFRWAIH